MPTIWPWGGFGWLWGGSGRQLLNIEDSHPSQPPPKRGGTVGARTVSGGCEAQVQLFDRLSAVPFLTNEKTASQTAFRPVLAAGVAQNRHWRDPHKIPEQYRSNTGVTRLQVACRALWARKSKDSGDCGLSGKRASEKSEGRRQNAEIRGKRAEVNRPSRERRCSEYGAGGGP